MRTACLLFFMIGCAALMCGTTRAVSRRRLGENHPIHSPNEQARSGQKRDANRRANTPGTATDFRQIGSNKSTGVPDRMFNRRPLPRPPAGSAVSGQFKNAHNRASGLAIIGGPASSTRSAAAINGTSINRKP